MKLCEFEGKALFGRRGIPIPAGKVADHPLQAAAAALELGKPVVVKAQVQSGKRGKAGGVKRAADPAEAETVAAGILGMEIGGERVEQVLVEEQVAIAQELYAGVTLDPGTGQAVLIFSVQGGMDIEAVADEDPSALATMQLDGISPVRPYQVLETVKRGGLGGAAAVAVGAVLEKLIALFFALDCTTAEINPLVVTTQGEVIAADSKLVLDDSALYRHKDLGLAPREEELTDLERQARDAKLAYVPLGQGGNIGIIAGGAGLAMATMDMVAAHGGRPANFLDTGGGVSADQMATAVRVVAADPAVEGILINVFGGINNCAIMAEGIARVLKEDGLKLPIVVKMRGHNQDEGWATMAEWQVPVVKLGTTEEAVVTLLDVMKGGAA
jgi:succinyl-CoA synthetase beta subunit